MASRALSLSAHSADVLLLSDPSCRLSALVPRSDAHGVLFGRRVRRGGQPVYRMEFIDKDADLKVGDEVVTSGLGGLFPGGLLVGYIETVEDDRSGLYQVADVLPAADLGHLRVVFVVNADRGAGEETP